MPTQKPKKPFNPSGWTYGQHADPTTWHEAADILKKNKKKPAKAHAQTSINPYKR